MRNLLVSLFLAMVVSAQCNAQGEVPRPDGGPSYSKGEIVYVVQLTEFRMKNTSNTSVTAKEILEALSAKNNAETIEIIETVRLTGLRGHESMMQIGRRASVTVGVTNGPGRAVSRQMQQHIVGTMVRFTAEPVEGKTLLKLSYEASRFEGDGSEESPPDTKTFQISTTMLLEESIVTLVGGTSSDASTYLAVTVKSDQK